MSDYEKTKEQLILELEYLRQRAIDLVRRSNPEEEYEWLLEGYRTYRHFFEKGAALNMVFDAQGNLEDVNESFLINFGYSKEDVIGKPVLNFVVPEEHEQVAAYMQQEFSGKPVGQVAIRAIAKDGSIRTLISSSELPAAIIYKAGKPAKMFAAFTDITRGVGPEGELARLSDELQRARGQLQALRQQLQPCPACGRLHLDLEQVQRIQETLAIDPANIDPNRPLCHECSAKVTAGSSES